MSLRYGLAALLLLAATAPAAHAQTCAEPVAETEISLSDVRAKLFNDGALFWRGGTDVYNVPKADGLSPIFAAVLWAGGTVGGEPRIAAAVDIGQGEFRPGPLGADGEPLPQGCTTYNRIYTVTAPELAAFEAGNPPSAALAGWPVGLGAPAVDASGEPVVPASPGQTVDLATGERPVVYGTETAFWVMNDVRERIFTDSDPLRAELRVSAFLVNDPNTPALDQGSFYRVEAVNKSGATIEEFQVGMWVLYALGDFTDDYYASDPGRSLGYVYNGDEVDGPGLGGYGIPPAAGVDVLSGGWSSLSYENTNSDETGIPRDLAEWVNLLQGRWIDGTPISPGGLGYNPGTTVTTRWQWNGDPVSRGFWTEDNPFGTSESREPGERRAILSSEPVTLPPGASHTVDFAVLFAQGADRLDSVTELRAASDLVQARYDDGSLFATTSGDLGLPPLAAPTLVSPADGAVIAPPETVRLEWAAVGDASAYQIELSNEDDFTGQPLIDESVTSLALDVPLDLIPQDTGEPLFWRVTPLNESGRGPASEARSFTYTFTFTADVTTLSNGQFAFVEVTGPGGADPCGPDAESTFGCAEVGGNAVYVAYESETPDANGTGAYALTAINPGPENTLPGFAPRDYEIRFTAEGSIGYHIFGEAEAHETHRVPFEIWDIGVVPPDEANDPADDVRMVPMLLSDDGGDGRGTCAFDLAEVPVGAPDNPLGVTLSDRIYAYYSRTTYADFDAVAAPLVDAADDACYDDADGALNTLIDFGRRRPIQRVVVADLTGDADVAALQGTVIRFYTSDPQPVSGDAAPVPSALALSVFPNPSRGAARVRFTLPTAGAVRVRVVDTLGRTVAVLADGARAAGPHEVSVPVRLAAGVYVVTVDADGERAARTLTVVR